jgi:hypothetical protein
MVYRGSMRLLASVDTAPDRRNTFVYRNRTFGALGTPMVEAGSVVYGVESRPDVMTAAAATRER